MAADATKQEAVEASGWRIMPGFAGQASGTDFYAVYEGKVFGNAERGLAAIIARGHAEPGGEAGGQEAAQLAVHSFAEGYFEAQRTFGPKRAAQLALTSLNAWLHGQVRTGTARKLSPVSLTALLFYGDAMGIVHIGVGEVFRKREGRILPLMREAAPGGNSRAIGRDLELSVDYQEQDAAGGDVLVLAMGPECSQEKFLEPLFRLETPATVSCIRLEILAAPDAQSALRGELAELPLRKAPREGEVWDGFEIGKTIYQGRYTVLKLAWDRLQNREVVLKIPLPSMLQDEVFSAGFMREAWIGSKVRGNNVARYIDLPAERRSSLYLVMPYYQGETLEKRLNRAPPMPLPDGIGIALKLCEAVQDLAAIEIVHRDLKPENIMLLENNELKLLDLGLAYLPGIDMRNAVKAGGTLRYMAPELLKGVQANARSEVYALAVTIYRMFSGGAYPFGQREPVPLARLRPDLPGWLGRILQKGLENDPAERFADAGEMGQALYEQLVSGAPDAARKRRFPRITGLQAWRAAALAFAIAFFALLILDHG